MAKRRRRRNPTRRAIATAVVVAAVATVGVTSYVVWHRSARKKRLASRDTVQICAADPGAPVCRLPQDTGPALPDRVAVEPAESWQTRWDAKRKQAVTTCRRDPDVLSWPQAVTCGLDVAFPEASPWTDPASWSPWQHAAAVKVELDLRESVAKEFATNDPTGWQALLWLTGSRLARACTDADPAIDATEVAHCIATSLYPEHTWPATATSEPWEKSFYAAARQLALNWVRPKPLGGSSWAAAPPP